MFLLQKAFWDWYVENDSMLSEMMKKPTVQLISLIDKWLSPVFPYFKDVQFLLGGYKEGKYEFILNHCGNKYLIRDAEILKSMMPVELSDHIDFLIEE